MINNIDELEKTIEKNTALSFDEYQAIREPSVNIIVNDYAVKLVEQAKERGEELTLKDAKEIAKREIPAAFVPEWMKNLRISANIAGTELCYLEGLRSALERIEDLLRVVFEERIDEYIDRHADDFKAEVMNDGTEHGERGERG